MENDRWTADNRLWISIEVERNMTDLTGREREMAMKNRFIEK